MFDEPSGKRPWETPVVWPVKLKARIWMPADENRPIVSPDLLSLNLTWSGPALGLLSAMNWNQASEPMPIKDNGGTGDIVFFVRSSVKKSPPMGTGCEPEL